MKRFVFIVQNDKINKWFFSVSIVNSHDLMTKMIHIYIEYMWGVSNRVL